jgi:hypothetical protein
MSRILAFAGPLHPEYVEKSAQIALPVQRTRGARPLPPIARSTTISHYQTIDTFDGFTPFRTFLAPLRGSEFMAARCLSYSKLSKHTIFGGRGIDSTTSIPYLRDADSINVPFEGKYRD